jgi:hypothetical protein
MNKTEIKLKVAAEEIKEILRKHDIAASVALHSPGHGEFFLHLNPSYSCAYIYNDNELRFYSKKEDYNSREEQFEKQTSTVNMMRILTDLAANNFMILDPLAKRIEEVTNAEHTKGKMKHG